MLRVVAGSQLCCGVDNMNNYDYSHVVRRLTNAALPVFVLSVILVVRCCSRCIGWSKGTPQICVAIQVTLPIASLRRKKCSKIDAEIDADIGATILAKS